MLFTDFCDILTGEASDSKAVCGVELPHEKLATGFSDGGHLKDG